MPRVPFDPATDYYQLLGVPPAASADEIQAAYRRLAKVYHPDLHAGSAMAATRMARLNIAKSVLLDRATRADYDRLRGMRRQVTRVATVVVPQQHQVAYAPRPGYRSASATVGRPMSSGMDRTTGVLLLIVLPLLGALLLYVIQAVQLAGQPVRSSPVDLSFVPGRTIPRNTADAVFLMVHGQPPSRALGLSANNLIISRADQTPEGELLRTVGRHLLQSGTAGDAEGWEAAVAEVCALATRC